MLSFFIVCFLCFVRCCTSVEHVGTCEYVVFSGVDINKNFQAQRCVMVYCPLCWNEKGAEKSKLA